MNARLEGPTPSAVRNNRASKYGAEALRNHELPIDSQSLISGCITTKTFKLRTLSIQWHQNLFQCVSVSDEFNALRLTILATATGANMGQDLKTEGEACVKVKVRRTIFV